MYFTAFLARRIDPPLCGKYRSSTMRGQWAESNVLSIPIAKYWSLISCLFGTLSAYEIPVSGLVINRQFASRMPSFDKLWNVPNFFERAHRVFGDFGRGLSVNAAPPVQIMHWTYPVSVRVSGARNIYTLHDLVPLRLPYTTLDNKLLFLKLVKNIVRGADHIVTVSEHSKRDIVALLEVPESKVTNTYQAVEIPSSYLQPSD